MFVPLCVRHRASQRALDARAAGRTPAFTTKDPTVVYLPAGTYLVTGTLTLWFYTHLVGNFACRPTLLLKPGAFVGDRCAVRAVVSSMAMWRRQFVLSGDTSYSGDHDDEFYRAIMHVPS